MLESLTINDFADKIGQSFKIRFEENVEVDLTLSKVEPGKHKTPGTMREPFSLIFNGPEDLRLSQGAFPLENEALGNLPIFMVPVGQNADGTIMYQAIFS
ncbi:MAG TPA: hypothetical protein VED21_30470 [Azospirillum sp.]|nr:hypothetical protein [Azospirillum sp.]